MNNPIVNHRIWAKATSALMLAAALSSCAVKPSSSFTSGVKLNDIDTTVTAYALQAQWTQRSTTLRNLP